MPNHLRFRVRAHIGVLAATALLAAFAACGSATSATTASATATETIDVPPSWALYSDPDGSFRLAQPPGWSVTRGSSLHGYHGQGYNVQVTQSDTVLQGSYASLTISAWPVSDDGYRRYGLCPHWKPDTTLAGLPAQQAATGFAPHYWLIYREDVAFAVQYSSPFDPSLSNGPPPTPIPTATAGAVQDELDQMLASLRIKPDAPLSC